MNNPLTKNIIVVALGLIVCFVLGVIALKPALANLSSLNHELDQKNTDVANLQQQVRAYQTAESDLNHATRKNEIAESILTKEELVDAVKEVESAAAKSGTDEAMQITDPFVAKDSKAPAEKPTPTAVPQNANTVQVPYQLVAKSSYLSLIDFMSYLEHLPNFTEVTKIQMIAETAGGSQNTSPVHTGRVISTIDAIFYVQK